LTNDNERAQNGDSPQILEVRSLLRSREEAEDSLAEFAETFYLIPARAWERCTSPR
jgi:hypothetical protein